MSEGEGAAAGPSPSPAPARTDQARHTDWIYNRLSARGDADTVAALRASTVGPGTVPWQDDLDTVAEDWRVLMLAQPPEVRELDGAEVALAARLLRNAYAAHRDRRSALSNRLGGVHRGRRLVPFDLHAVLPLPDPLLRLGPVHPTTLTWMREHWGTVEPLRSVVELPAARRDREPHRDPHLFWVGFWSADWSPWQALLRLRKEWPDLVIELEPVHDDP